jgi:hypothetical protein
MKSKHFNQHLILSSMVTDSLIVSASLPLSIPNKPVPQTREERAALDRAHLTLEAPINHAFLGEKRDRHRVILTSSSVAAQPVLIGTPVGGAPSGNYLALHAGLPEYFIAIQYNKGWFLTPVAGSPACLRRRAITSALQYEITPAQETLGTAVRKECFQREQPLPTIKPVTLSFSFYQ